MTNKDLYSQLLKPENVIETKFPTVSEQMSVIDAITRINQQNSQSCLHYNYVLVVEEAKLVGILTERDIVKLSAAEINLTEVKVGEVMTTKLITFKKSHVHSISMTLSILHGNQIRHLPIIDDLGQLEGVISVESIFRGLHPSNLLKFRLVKEAMTTQVFHALTTASVLSLSQIMTKNRSSCVVIVESRLSESAESNHPKSLLIPIGIITERDIVQFQILGLDLAQTTAQTVMSTPLVCLKTTHSLMQARQRMENLRVRRLVVTGEWGELRGIITQLNMLKVLDPAELYGIVETLQEELNEQTIQLQKEIAQRQQTEVMLRENQELLRREKELAKITLQSIADGVITTDTVGKIHSLNPMAEKLTGWKVKEAKQLSLSKVFNIIDESTRESSFNLVEEVLQANQAFSLLDNSVLIARDLTEYYIEHSVALIRNCHSRVIGVVVVFRDVTSSRQLTHQLSWQATHDALTGLYNRRQFEEKLIEAISSAKNEKHEHALCYLDLDQFKIVNDTCGHAAGDELLRQVTQLLNQRVRSSDVLARLGGDEFGLLLHQCPLHIAVKIANILRQMIEAFRFTWEERVFNIGVSIGLVEIDSITENLNSLMSAADASCYAAKERGRNCIYIYQNNDIELSRQRGERQWIARLNQALEENRFCLYSQRIVSVQDHTQSNHYEILLRLYDKQRQLILPGAFIPAAERYDLMPAIDRWVITSFFARYERYCQERKNQQLDLPTEVYAINLSGASINHKQFHLFLQEQFTHYQISPATICFEITETAAIANLTTAAEFIQELKALGCSIALDDFGSGMSSLTYLKNLPVDYLKIDGSFVKNIVDDLIDRTAVECFNRLGQVMKIKTVAEFVENDSIFQKLRSLGVDYAQGYGIGRPQPLVFN